MGGWVGAGHFRRHPVWLQGSIAVDAAGLGSQQHESIIHQELYVSVSSTHQRMAIQFNNTLWWKGLQSACYASCLARGPIGKWLQMILMDDDGWWWHPEKFYTNHRPTTRQNVKREREREHVFSRMPTNLPWLFNASHPYQSPKNLL